MKMVVICGVMTLLGCVLVAVVVKISVVVT